MWDWLLSGLCCICLVLGFYVVYVIVFVVGFFVYFVYKIMYVGCEVGEFGVEVVCEF